MNSRAPVWRQRKALFSVLFVSLAAALLWAAAAYFRGFEQTHRREVESQLTAVVDLKAAELARWRQERIGDASLFAANPVFSRLVRACFAGEAGSEDVLRVWLGRFQAAYAYDAVLLLDSGFRKRIVIPDRPERAISFVSPASEAQLRAGEVVLEDFYQSDGDGKIYLKVLAPVLDGDAGSSLLAVVGLRIDPNVFLYPFIARWPTPSLTAETLLVRRDGTDALYLNELRFRRGSALSLRMPLARTDVPIVKAALGARGVVDGTDYRGVPVIAAVRPVEGSPWFLAARVDAAEVLAPVRERAWLAAVVAGALLLAGAAGIGFVLRTLSARADTERVRAAGALDESQARLHAITESAQDAILMMDGSGNVSYWNPAAERILGYTAEEVKGRNLHDLIAPQRFHAAHLPAYREFLRTGQGAAVGQTRELTALRRDGREIAVALSLSGVRIEGAWHAVGILRDITDRKNTEEVLQRALEEKAETNERLEAASALAHHMAHEAEAASLAKSQFLANMSHEIRTPMNGVLGMTGLLLDSNLTDEQRRFAVVVRASAESLLAVINDILDFSKIEAGKLELAEVDFDLRTLLEDVAEMHAVRAQDKGLELVCRIDPGMPTFLRGDPGRLRQMLVNLIGNAIKFTPKGEVVVEAAAGNETASSLDVRFEVRDTGIGIPEGKLGLLFNAFQQVDASTTRQYGGTGLGLAICRRLARLMGGEIGVTSVEGEGSTFWFSVFLRKQEHSRGEGIEMADVKGVRILAVDDNATNRLVISEQLSSWGVRHEEAESAAQALRMLHAAVTSGDPFRIVITDMQMPVTDGESLGRAVKEDPLLEGTLLVMMTSLGLRGDARRLEQIGFSAYLTKPVKQSQLHDCLATVLGRSRKKGRTEAADLLTRHSLSESRRRSFRILLAEDNATNQQVALGVLEKLGYRAEAVANGLEAVEALRAAPYDLVFMDVQMPVMDGFEATRTIRSDAVRLQKRRVPIIAMTAHAMKGDRERCLQEGMDDYVSKPIVPAELAAALEKWLPTEEGPTLLPPSPSVATVEALPVFDRVGFETRLMGDADLIEEITRGFLEDVPTKLAALAEAVRQGDPAEASRQAHSLKGSSANVGAVAMSAVAGVLEAAASAGRIEAVAALAPDLEAAFAVLEPRMKELLR
ncbi:MAG: response regulator [Holophagales bacterium]|nr:response regulator [Holophagales bacterium]